MLIILKAAVMMWATNRAIEATVEYALKRPEMRGKLLEYLKHIVDVNKE